MNDLSHNIPHDADETELRELEAELCRFRPAPLPPAVQQRMLAAVTAVSPRPAAKNYSRYLAPVTALLLLSVVAYSLPQVPNTPTPFYVPVLACMAGILMLTMKPRSRRVRVCNAAENL